MPQFRFKLEGVLEHRRNIERQRQRQCAVFQQQLQALQAELKDLDQSVQGAASDLRSTHLTGTIDLNYLAAHRRFTAATRRKAMALVQRIALVQRQLDDARKVLTSAAVQRKIIEKLREKQLERWKAEYERRDTAQTDEIGVQLAYRRILEAENATDGEI